VGQFDLQRRFVQKRNTTVPLTSSKRALIGHKDYTEYRGVNCYENILAALAFGGALVAAAPASHAVTISLDISSADLGGEAKFIAGGGKIKFDPRDESTATFTFPSIPGTQYVISVTGHNDQSSSFFQFLIDANGPVAGGYVPLGGNRLPDIGL